MCKEMETIYKEIRDAVEILKQGSVNRMDGPIWTAYKVGNIIRIDIKTK